MRAIGSPRLRGGGVRGAALAATVTALVTGMTAGLWPPAAGAAPVVAAAGSWGRAIEVPGLAPLNTSGDAGVDSVSCASAGNCVAGGSYSGPGGDGFVAAERDGVWGTATAVPGLAALDAGGDADVWSVSCVSAGTSRRWLGSQSGHVTGSQATGPVTTRLLPNDGDPPPKSDPEAMVRV